MSKKNRKSTGTAVVTECGNPDFDWSAYEDGWNGKSLKANNRVKTNSQDIIYCHESYATELYNKMSGTRCDGAKDLVKNALVSVTDIKVLDENNVSLSINNGSNNVIVDMNKEGRFLNQFTTNEGTTVDKETFMKLLNTDFKQQLLGMNLSAKLTAGDPEKASIWDGYVEILSREMREQISKKSKAYYATILGTNRGGFIVEIMNTVKAFMPGSMAASNRITDFDAMIGKTLEVMVEAFDPNYGFVVSRKKYLQTLQPLELEKLENAWAENPEMQVSGRVTGTTTFGVFVEINEYITGMVHKTLVDDETRQRMRDMAIEEGSMFTAYIHKIDGPRVILSTVPLAERDAVIAKREAEEEEEDRLKAEMEAKLAEASVELPEEVVENEFDEVDE